MTLINLITLLKKYEDTVERLETAYNELRETNSKKYPQEYRDLKNTIDVLQYRLTRLESIKIGDPR